MKRIVSLLLAAATALSLAGCNDEEQKNSDSSSIAENTSSVNTVGSENQEGFVKDPNKPTLVWLTYMQMTYEDDLNEYLDEAGYDFYISFQSVDGGDNIDEEGAAQTAKSAGADIIDTHSMFENSYPAFAQSGLFEPLDNYLADTESGKELYEFMPESYWENLRYEGEIYGVDSWLTCLQSDIEFELNNPICEELDIGASDFEGDYLAALDMVAEICAENDLVFGIHSLETLSSWIDREFINGFIYIDENGNAANIYESEAALQLFEKIAEHYDSGYFSNGNEIGEKSIAEVLGYTRSTTAAEGRNGFVSSDDEGIDTTSGVASLSVCNNRHSSLGTSYNATGIYSGSDNKDLAFEAVCALMTDEEFINILNYGKGPVINNGCASKDEYGGMPMGNAALMLSVEGRAPADRGEKMYNELALRQAGEYSGFYFDTENVDAQIEEINNMLFEINDEFIPLREDENGNPIEGLEINAQEYLADLNARLYDAGMQDILDEANRQLEEFYSPDN